MTAERPFHLTDRVKLDLLRLIEADNLKPGGSRHPVFGLWMIDQQCCGLGIRESSGLITDNLSSFIPHYFS